MNNEELIKSNMKNIILDNWKSKLSYPLNHKDIEELENIIDYYEGENQKYKEVIDKLKEWEQTHTILVYTKEAPRQLVGTHELLHLLYDEESDSNECI